MSWPFSALWRDDATLLDFLRAARLAQAAVLHELLVLGEAAKRLSAAFREEHPDVPWKAIAGMRDRLLHGYDDVDLDLVWKTVDCPRCGAEMRTSRP